MKRQLMILATAFTPIVFFSCTKEKTGMTPTTHVATSETTGDTTLAAKPATNSNPYRTGVTGWFDFNGNLKDKSGLLADAKPIFSTSPSYTTGRNGAANQAIKFSGRYGLDIFNVPFQPNSSVSAWVKYSTVPATNATYYFVSSGIGPNFAQQYDQFWGVITTPLTDGVASASLNGDWHHLVATYDGNQLKFYVDGTFVGASNNPSQLASQVLDYHIGYYTGATNVYWQGAIDELTFFKRTLSAYEVYKISTM